MKKVLFIILLLFIPLIAKAEVKITSVELDNSTVGLNAEKNPSYQGLKINFNLKFTAIEEFARYKVTIKNDTTKEYEINTEKQFEEGKDEYIKYDFKMDNNIIKPNEEKILYITVTYNKEVPKIKFVNGIYQETNAMSLDLSNQEQAKAQRQEMNPNTRIGYPILILSVITFISLLVIVINKYKLDHLSPFVLAIAISIAIPLTAYAIEKITIVIETKIEIIYQNPKLCVETINRSWSNGEKTDILRNTEEYEFIDGTTWNEYLSSELNDNNFETLELYPEKVALYGTGAADNVCNVGLLRDETPATINDLIISSKEGCYQYVIQLC